MAPATSPVSKHYLVVVADEYRAILYARDSLRGPLRKLRQFTNETARMKIDELIADRGGHSNATASHVGSTDGMDFIAHLCHRSVLRPESN